MVLLNLTDNKSWLCSLGEWNSNDNL
uniref:Uncharacterized protein n=1 Tax=Arundo donax TaxID=35708 RepID=A0A0A8YQ42_ARUDO